MNTYQKLYEQGLLKEETLNRANDLRKNPQFTIQKELHTLLYAGVLLLSTGLAILIYEHLGSISHLLILGLIAALCAGCFTYTFRNCQPFQRGQVARQHIAADYMLLLGCFSLLSLLAYLQFQFEFFGNRYGLATFIPTVILFYSAYRFDHKGVLSMAISNMALWMGVSISPQVLFGSTTLQQSPLIWTYILYAILLLLASYGSIKRQYKAHFGNLYLHFSIQILFIALLAAYTTYSRQNFHYFYLIILIGLSILLFQYAKRQKSFYLILTSIVYGYIAASMLFTAVLDLLKIGNLIELIMLWHIILPLILIRYLYNLSKKLKAA